MLAQRLLITFFLLISFKGLKAQDWFPVGATWHYTERFFFSGDLEFLTISVEKDTVIQGIACKKMIKNKDLYCMDHERVEYVYESGDSVFLFVPDFNRFQLVYDLNMSSGDTLNFPILDNDMNGRELDTIQMRVNSTSFIMVNGRMLKQQHVDIEYLGDLYGYDGYLRQHIITQKIGSHDYFFYYSREFQGACDANLSAGLRCYSDSLLGLYETGIADSCNYIFRYFNTDEHNVASSEIDIYPIPSGGVFYVEGENLKNLSYRLFRGDGFILQRGRFENDHNSIDLRHFNTGIYFLEIEGEVHKLMKY
ncbi:MAG: T9SS type A sorting domain-containing protein [Croceimicrobium sp.]